MCCTTAGFPNCLLTSKQCLKEKSRNAKILKNVGPKGQQPAGKQKVRQKELEFSLKAAYANFLNQQGRFHGNNFNTEFWKRLTAPRSISTPASTPQIPGEKNSLGKIFKKSSSPSPCAPRHDQLCLLKTLVFSSKMLTDLHKGEFTTFLNNISHCFPNLFLLRNFVYVLFRKNEHHIFRKLVKWCIIEKSKVKLRA